MKLDPTVMRTMDAQDFRVLEAVETGMKHHALVPLPLINSIANLRHGGSHKIVSSLLRDKLLSHENNRHGCVDGYRLTNAGYDILALHNLKQRGFVAALGQRIGTGKESDIYLAADPAGHQIVLKLHRLGRNSFRNVKQKRDYFVGTGKQQAVMDQQAHSWLFLSRLSALREYAFMKALFDVQYPTPTPLAHNRHIVAMSLVRGSPLYQIHPKRISTEQAQDILDQSIQLAVRLAKKHGLVHCDLNEFNLLVDLSGGVQTQACSNAEDPYVRHSGASVAPETDTIGSNIRVQKSTLGESLYSVTGGGILSKPAWEQSLEVGDEIHEALPEPKERLPNGDPKPVVVLIDFPQMTSIRHPNAADLYHRDLNCLKRFFEQKLRLSVDWDVRDDDDESDDDDDDNNSMEHCKYSFAKVTAKALLQQSDSSDNDNNDVEKRLDEELKASGYSENSKFGMRDLELYYFEPGPKPVATGIINPVNEEDNEEEEQDDDDEDDEEEEEKVVSEDDGDENDENNKDVVVDNPKPESCENETNETVEKPVESDAEEHKDDCKKVTDDDDGVVQQHKQQPIEFDLSSMSSQLPNGLDRKQLEEIAKERVRKQLDDQRRKTQRKGAFRKTRNSNKTFVKGKRVMTDYGI